ncbi:FAD-dependent oxidoreductase [Pseudonocardia sp. H11422]|uniref:FAD-dependent oxidoreductase n=1 Tax=Pseudonocardia sp. H11422 TaxID=2835866 RepID=UPI001BDD38AE|nr:hypothetical protein [Pseudonocardia sp. H11422]
MAGLTCGLMLARAGRRVTVLERDGAALPGDIDEAAADWARPTVPQVQHAPGFMALARSVLARRLPDVLDDLLTHGAREFPLREWIPSTPAGADAIDRARTDELISLGCRRTTLEWVLRRCAAAQPRLTLVPGATVTGLMWRSGPVPRVIGVRTRAHGALRTDVVIDASGRRTEVDRWATDAGAGFPGWDEHCGLVVYTRFYRVRDMSAMPRMPRGNATVLVLDGCAAYAFLADNDTVAVVLARHPQDDDLADLRCPAVFEAAAAAVPPLAPWVDPTRTEPISPVAVMGGLRATMRFPLRDGRPRLLGMHAIGDALATTNPAYGRGASLAMAHGEIVTDGLAAEPDSPLRQAELISHRLTALTLPHWLDTVRHDRGRISLWRATLGLPRTAPPPRMSMPMPVAAAAGAVDADIWVRVARAVHMLDPPQSVFDHPALAARICDLDPPPLTWPARRADLLAAIGAPPALRSA